MLFADRVSSHKAACSHARPLCFLEGVRDAVFAANTVLSTVSEPDGPNNNVGLRTHSLVAVTEAEN